MDIYIDDEEYWEYLFAMGRDILYLWQKQDSQENVTSTNLYYSCERKDTYESYKD